MTLRERLQKTEHIFGHNHAEFLDEFRREKDPEMIKDSILDLPNLTDIQKALTAASIDQLCFELKIDKPDWIYDPSTFLKKPYFAGNPKGPFKIILLQESPKWFRARNLFVTENCLERV